MSAQTYYVTYLLGAEGLIPGRGRDRTVFRQVRAYDQKGRNVIWQMNHAHIPLLSIVHSFRVLQITYFSPKKLYNTTMYFKCLLLHSFSVVLLIILLHKKPQRKMHCIQKIKFFRSFSQTLIRKPPTNVTAINPDRKKPFYFASTDIRRCTVH